MAAVNHQHHPSRADRRGGSDAALHTRAARLCGDSAELARLTFHELRGSLILIALLLGVVAMLSRQ